jgi:hypothetical protein
MTRILLRSARKPTAYSTDEMSTHEEGAARPGRPFQWLDER